MDVTISMEVSAARLSSVLKDLFVSARHASKALNWSSVSFIMAWKLSNCAISFSTFQSTASMVVAICCWNFEIFGVRSTIPHRNKFLPQFEALDTNCYIVMSPGNNFSLIIELEFGIQEWKGSEKQEQNGEGPIRSTVRHRPKTSRRLTSSGACRLNALHALAVPWPTHDIAHSFKSSLSPS